MKTSAPRREESEFKQERLWQIHSALCGPSFSVKGNYIMKIKCILLYVKVTKYVTINN